MSSNIFLYDFNGSVQRNKLQDAIFRDLAQKDEFMKRLEEERIERQLLAKKKSAVVKIQSWYRANRTRRRFHALLRQNFDAVGKVATLDVLSAQIARLVLFFKASEDLGRTVSEEGGG
ncbi:unnamed protein product [Anisakis simplex]|uniref:FerB domain-containing protein n=1 Tax=Anisakis simplex TaxID=6269 RepID=A0A0M3J6E9_ANISI|nr:unnamed protein product [Anisakis simplex]